MTPVDKHMRLVLPPPERGGARASRQRPRGDDALLLAPFSASQVPSQIAEAARADPVRLCDRLRAAGLAALWANWVVRGEGTCVLPPDLRAWLALERRKLTACYALQRLAAARAVAILSASGVPCALFKGAAIRERLYEHPADRPAADLDLLVPAASRDQAVRALVDAGCVFHGSRQNISHAATLVCHHVDLDLHWGLSRPGRSRIDLVPQLLGATRLVGGLPLLDDRANLLVMLVHPAFAKHVGGRAARLVRVVDLDLMLRRTQPDWDWILARIDAAGLRVAAWAVLYRQRALMDTPVDAAVLRHLAPGRFQGRYLRLWIDRQLPARLGSIPGLVQAAFTLVLHDRPVDALRALARLLMVRLAARRTLKHLEGLTEGLGAGLGEGLSHHPG